jgi:hypothetical protein
MNLESCPRSKHHFRSKESVSFYLGCSVKPLASSQCSNDDMEVEIDPPDYYATVDADDHHYWPESTTATTHNMVRPCLSRMTTSSSSSTLRSQRRGPMRLGSQESSVSTLVEVIDKAGSDFAKIKPLSLDFEMHSDSAVSQHTTSPPESPQSQDSSMGPKHSLASLPRKIPSGIRTPLESMPPSPPVSPPIFAHPMSKFVEDLDDFDDNYRYQPISIWSTPGVDSPSWYCVQPADPTDNGLIPINLDPVSPLILAAAITDSSDSLVGLEQRALQELNLEEHPFICDKFHQRPLLADPEKPFIASSPVFPNIDELFGEHYPELIPGSVEYIHHKNRLLRNRVKLRRLSRSMNDQEEQRRQRISLARLHGEAHPRSKVKLY